MQKETSSELTFWIAKNSLTLGVREVRGKMSKSGDYFITGNGLSTTCFSLNEIYETRQEAIEKAEQMRKNKIASLEKQLQRLKDMQFV